MSAIKLHYEVDGTDFTRAGEASAAVIKTLRQLGINPGVIRKVDEMPLTKNGKIDRKKLAEIAGGRRK